MVIVYAIPAQILQRDGDDGNSQNIYSDEDTVFSKRHRFFRITHH